MADHTRIESFARRVVVAVLITLAILALAYVLFAGAHILLQAFAGLLFGVFLAALSDWLAGHTRLSRGWALTVVVVVLFVLAFFLGWMLESRLSQQLRAMAEQLSQSLERVRSYLDRYPWGQFMVAHLPSTAEQVAEAGGFAHMKGLLTGIASVVVGAIVIMVVGIFGAAEPDLYREGLLHLVPPPHRRRAGEAVDAVMFNLRWWLLGQIVLMVIIGLTTMVGLYLIGVPLALSLGLIAGIMEMVPYVGPWISAVPAALLALLLSPWHVVAVLGLYLFLHLLEGYVLLPLIQRRAVLLPPALTIVMQVLLGELLGFIGLFVAAPFTVTLMVLLKMLYVEDTLGDQAVNVPGEPGAEDRAEAGGHPEVRPRKTG